jgi:transposase
MAYREVTMIEVKEVLRRWLAGAKRKRIAAEVGLDPKTVRRYIGAAVDCGVRPAGDGKLAEEELVAVLARLRGDAVGRPRGERWARCEAERAFIERHLAQGVRLSKIAKLLRRRAVEVSYSMIYRYAVAELDFGKTAPTVPVADGEPGEEVQVDTGWMTYLEPDPTIGNGRRRRFRAWIFTPVVSRYRFAYPCLRETTESAIEACEAAWEFYGGVFRVFVVDNTRSIVQKADPLAPRLSATFLEYSQARGFHVETTRVRSPKDKARVERSVSFVRDDCFGGERLFAIEETRERARRWCLEDAGMRRHTTTQRLPREHFESVEKERLLPAPDSPYDVPIWSDPKVGRDHLCQVAKALYSLPTRFIGDRLHARADRSLVRFYDATLLVKTHPRKPPGGRSIDASDFPEHKTAYALRDVKALERQAARHGEATGRFATRLLDSPLPWTRMRTVYALLSLVRRFGDGAVEEACRTALDADMIDVHRLRRMLESRPRLAETSLTAPIIVPPRARFLRPATVYRLRRPVTAQTAREGENA